MAFDAGAVIGKAFLDTKAWKKGINIMQSTGQSLGNAFKKIAKAGAIATGAIVAGMVASVKKTDEFNKAFANVTTLVDTAVVDTGRMKQELLGLDSRLGSATDLTEGLYQALSASVEPAKAVEFVGEAAKFAKAALVDTNTAVDVITTGLNAYGLSADNANVISDILFQTIKRGKTTGAELSATLGQIIPIASSMNLSFENLGASMATMTRQGVKSAIATTQLRAIMTSLLKPSEELKKAMQKAGFETGEAVTSSENFQEALGQVIAQTDGSQEALAELFPNVRALQGALALTGEGAVGFSDDLKAMNESAGATDEAFSKQRLTFETLGVQVEKFAIAIGTNLLPVADKLAVGFGKLLAELTANEEFMIALVDIAESLGSIFENFVIPVLKNLIPVIANIVKFIAGIFEGISGLITQQETFRESIDIVGFAYKTLGERIVETNPALKENLTLTNLLAAANNENTKQLLAQIKANIATAAFQGNVNEAMKEAKRLADELAASLSGPVVTSAEEVNTAIGNLAGGFVELKTTGGDAFTELETDAADAVSNTADSFTALETGLIETTFLVDQFAANFIAKQNEIDAAITKTTEETKKKYEDMAKTIVSVVSPIFVEMGQMFIDSEKGWADVGKVAAQAIATVVRGLGELFAIKAAEAALQLNFLAAAGWAGLSVASFVAAGVIEALANQISAKAEGGITTPGLTLVGEEGPELFNLGRTGTIIPAAETRSLMGGISMQITFTGPVSSEVDIEQAMMVSGRRLQNKMRRIS